LGSYPFDFTKIIKQIAFQFSPITPHLLQFGIILNKHFSNFPKRYFILLFKQSIYKPMKKLLLFAATLLLTAGLSFAGNDGVFSYDAAAVETQMAQLAELEGFLAENPDATLSDMIASGNTLASLVTGPNSIDGFSLLNEKVLGIPGFLWGCVLSWVGIVIVYLVGQDPHETKQAIIGCVVGAVAYGAFYAIYALLLRSAWGLGSWGGII
jgi:hypothetical protein